MVGTRLRHRSISSQGDFDKPIIYRDTISHRNLPFRWDIDGHSIREKKSQGEERKCRTALPNLEQVIPTLNPK